LFGEKAETVNFKRSDHACFPLLSHNLQASRQFYPSISIINLVCLTTINEPKNNSEENLELHYAFCVYNFGVISIKNNN